MAALFEGAEVAETAYAGSEALELGATTGTGARWMAGGAALAAEPSSALASIATSVLFPAEAEALMGTGRTLARGASASLGLGPFATGFLGEVGAGTAKGLLTVPVGQIGLRAIEEEYERIKSLLKFLEHDDTEMSPEPTIINHPETNDRYLVIHYEKATPMAGGRTTTFPKTKKMTLRWSSPMSLSTNSSVVTADRILGNSIVNPGDSGGGHTDGHEPLGFTQMAAVYSEYTVTDVRVRWDYYNRASSDGGATTNLEGVILGISFQDSVSALNTKGHYMELGDCIWQVCPPEGYGRLVHHMKPGRFFGVPDSQVRSDDTLRGQTAGANPSNLLWVHFWTQTTEGTGAAFNVDGAYTIEYDVVFQQPKQLAQS